MECPYWGEELSLENYYGNYLGYGKWNKHGDIYECKNINCVSKAFNYCFHTNNENLHEGYPC